MPRVCADSTTFLDVKGLSCQDWAGLNCSEAEGYTSAARDAVKDACQKSCGICAAPPPPRVTAKEAKKVSFGLELKADFSSIPKEKVETALRASAAAALGVPPENIVSVTFVAVDDGSRRLPSAPELGRGASARRLAISYAIKYEVVVPPSVVARSIISQATRLADPASSSTQSFGDALTSAGVDPSSLELTGVSQPSTSTVKVLVHDDGSLAATAPAAPAPSPAAGANTSSGGAGATADPVAVGTPTTSALLVSGACEDSASFVDQQGEGCSGWVGYDCASTKWLNTDKPYTAKGLLDVQASCPLACGSCSPPARLAPPALLQACVDDAFIASFCLRWRGMDCSDAVRLGYSPSYTALLLGRCPLSCGLCGIGAPPAQDAPGFVDELGSTCESWQGYDCTKMVSRYSRKGMLEVQAACQKSCGFTPVASLDGVAPRRLAATPGRCEDNSSFAYVGRFRCPDFVGRICTYGTLYLEPRWLLGPRASLAWHETLWSSCPVSCGVCDPPGRPAPADLGMECVDDPYLEDWCVANWKGQHCKSWQKSLNLVLDGEGQRFNSTLLGRCPSTCGLCVPPVCEAGTFRNQTAHLCVDCGPGTYSDVARSGPEAAACLPARPGFFISEHGARKDDPCPKGRFQDQEGSAACKVCEPGTYTDKRAATGCLSCQPGWFQSENGSSACVRCPLGQYQPEAGSSECVSCPAGFSTLLQASTNASDCGCPPGTYRPVDSSSCRECPRGVFCPGGHSQFDAGLDTTPQLMPGMMSLPEDPFSVYTCVGLEVQCPDYRPMPYTDELFAVVCPGGMIGPRCNRCPDHFYEEDYSCTSCGEFTVWNSGLNFVVAFLFGVYSTERVYTSNERFRSQGQFIFFTLLDFMQYLPPIVKLPIKFPAILLFPFNFFVYFSIPGWLDFFDLNQNFVCIVGDYFFWDMVKNVLMPLIPFLSIPVLWMVFPLLCRKFENPKAICAVAGCFDGFWLSLCVMAVSLFPSDVMPNGKQFLRWNPGVEFGSKEWIQTVPVGLGAIMVWVCGFLTFTIKGVCQAPRRALEEPGFLDKLAYTIYVQRPECYWWGMIYYSMNFVFAMVQAFTGTVYWQIYASMFVFLMVMSAEIYVYPHVHRQVNRVNVAIKSALMFMLVVSTTFVDLKSPDVEGPSRQEFVWWFYILFLVVLSATIFFAAHAIWRNITRRNQRSALRSAHRSRSVMNRVVCMRDHDFIAALKNGFDPDWECIAKTTEMLARNFLGWQPGPWPHQQAIIHGAPWKVFDKSWASWKAQEMIARRLVMDALDEHATLDGLLMKLKVAAMKDKDWDPPEDSVSFHIRRLLDRQPVQGPQGARSRFSFLNALLLEDKADSPKAASVYTPKEQAFFSEGITEEQFVEEFGPMGVLSEKQLRRLFKLLDWEGDNEVQPSRIAAVIFTRYGEHPELASFEASGLALADRDSDVLSSQDCTTECDSISFQVPSPTHQNRDLPCPRDFLPPDDPDWPEEEVATVLSPGRLPTKANPGWYAPPPGPPPPPQLRCQV